MKAPDEIAQRARVDLMKRYLADPRPWPDGIDWGSHWYTSNKEYWDALARGESVGESLAPDSSPTDSAETATNNQIAELLSQGLSIRDIAEQLDISIGRVQRYKAKLAK